MYIRPQLFRKITGNREILELEHKQELELHERILQKGRKYESFRIQLDNVIQKLEMSEVLSADDRIPILIELSEIVKSLQAEYDDRVYEELSDIEFSINNRIEEMKTASQKWSEEVYLFKKTKYEVNTVNFDKFYHATVDVLDKYNMLIEKSSSELQKQMEQSELQREIVRRHIHSKRV